MDMSLSSLRRHFASQKPESRRGLEKTLSPAENTINMGGKANTNKANTPASAPVVGGNIARFALETPGVRDALRRHLLASGEKLLPHDKGAAVLKADIAEKKRAKSNKERTS